MSQAALAVATAVPFFDDLTSLIGALQTPLVGFCIPAALYACGRRLYPDTLPVPTVSVLTGAYCGFCLTPNAQCLVPDAQCPLPID